MGKRSFEQAVTVWAAGNARKRPMEEFWKTFDIDKHSCQGKRTTPFPPTGVPCGEVECFEVRVTYTDTDGNLNANFWAHDLSRPRVVCHTGHAPRIMLLIGLHSVGKLRFPPSLTASAAWGSVASPAVEAVSVRNPQSPERKSAATMWC